MDPLRYMDKDSIIITYVLDSEKNRKKPRKGRRLCLDWNSTRCNKTDSGQPEYTSTDIEYTYNMFGGDHMLYFFHFPTLGNNLFYYLNQINNFNLIAV